MTRKLLITSFMLSTTFLSVGAELTSTTKNAYRNYIVKLEARLNQQSHSPNAFLWIDQDADRLKAVRSGSIATEHKNMEAIPGGMIQHWIGAIYMASATIDRVKHVDQDYAEYARIYKPEITLPKVISHDGNHYLVSYRITKKKVLTAVVDTVHAIDYQPLGPDRSTVQSRSISVTQVENQGTPSERVLPEGEGAGLLWAVNSYWRMQERDGGVYVECEAITLSRDVPFLLGPMINPILQSFAEESLKKTLEAKRLAVVSLR